MCQTAFSVRPSPQICPARFTRRKTLPSSIPAAAIQISSCACTQSGMGTVRMCPASAHFEKSTLKKQHRKALRLSRVRPFVLYSLRHTFLTRLGESGCDAWTLARIAGHSSTAMSARYVHPSEDAVLAAVERLSGHNFGHNAPLALADSSATEDASANLSVV